MHRIQVFYSGRVQGVGFRYTTKRIADQYVVTGWVRNRCDGRVEIIAEGADSELKKFYRSESALRNRNERLYRENRNWRGKQAQTNTEDFCYKLNEMRVLSVQHVDFYTLCVAITHSAHMT